MVEKLASGGSLDGGYVELCHALPQNLLRPCMVKQMQVLFDLLASYHVMAKWHMQYVQQQQQLQQLQQLQQQPEQHPMEITSGTSDDDDDYGLQHNIIYRWLKGWF